MDNNTKLVDLINKTCGQDCTKCKLGDLPCIAISTLTGELRLMPPSGISYSQLTWSDLIKMVERYCEDSEEN